jgi:hypothetical protein
VKLAKKIYHKSWDMQGKLHVFLQIFLLVGFWPLLPKNSGSTAVNFSRPTIFFVGPVLSYFAEFSAGWHQCKNYVLNKTGQTVTQTYRYSTSIPNLFSNHISLYHFQRPNAITYTELIFHMKNRTSKGMWFNYIFPAITKTCVDKFRTYQNYNAVD